MSYGVHELPRAVADVQHIARWLCERSVRGAGAWMNAYDEMVARLSKDALSFAAAPETHSEFDVKQALSKLAMYEFTQDDDVYLLRVRGPGQDKVDPESLK